MLFFFKFMLKGLLALLLLVAFLSLLGGWGLWVGLLVCAALLLPLLSRGPDA